MMCVSSCATVLLLSGIRFVQPGKAWRPIVAIEVEAGTKGNDGRAAWLNETLLVVEWQRMNQRESMVM